MQNSTEISLDSVASVAEFYAKLSEQLGDGSRRIRNADALADLLQEAGITRVRVAEWNVPLKDSLVIFAVFADVSVTLQIGSRD